MKLNLIYHLAPLENSNYFRHLNILNHYHTLFDGVKVLAITQGEGCVDLDPNSSKKSNDFKYLEPLLPHFHIHFLPNDPDFGEVSTWPYLIQELKTYHSNIKRNKTNSDTYENTLAATNAVDESSAGTPTFKSNNLTSSIKSTTEDFNELKASTPTTSQPFSHLLNQDNYTLYAHGKGVSREKLDTPNKTINLWANMLYYLNFYPKNVEKHLTALSSRKYLVSGGLKREGKTAELPDYCDFYYQGTFFWLNTHHLLTTTRKPDPKNRFGVECFPSRLCHTKQANNIFGTSRDKSLYSYKVSYPLSKTMDAHLKHPEGTWEAYQRELYALSKPN